VLVCELFGVLFCTLISVSKNFLRAIFASAQQRRVL
jgi:hypothetical protein